jgi:hypothetical protein
VAARLTGPPPCLRRIYLPCNFVTADLDTGGRRWLALADGRSAFAACLAGFFRRPLVSLASKMGEFPTLTCDFALSVSVHGRESAFACRHLTSVGMRRGTALRMPQMSLGVHFQSSLCIDGSDAARPGSRRDDRS